MSRLVFFQVDGQVEMREMPSIPPKRAFSPPSIVGLRKRAKSGGIMKVWKRFNGLCCYCVCKTLIVATVTGRGTSVRQATREHIIRKTDGGDNSKANITLACFFCNTTRGARTPDYHQSVMLELKARGCHPCWPRQER